MPGQSDDHFELTTWDKYESLQPKGWARPNGNRLRSARRVRNEIAIELPHSDHISYVAGCAGKTPSGVQIDGDKIRIKASPRGDGTVLWDGGIPRGIDVWYAPAKHGKLLDHEHSFRAYEELLTSGTTTRLPRTAPETRTARPAAEDLYMEEPERTQLFPSEDELLEDLLASDGDEPAGEEQPIEIIVCHGNVRYSRYPVLLSHYRDDGIYSAEKAVDKMLDGRLSRRWSLGDYPGPIGSTATIFEDKGHRLAQDEITNPRTGAIVVGLGTIGELTRGGLIATLEQGLRTFSSRCSEEGLRNHTNGLAITALLVGSGEGGVGVEEAVRSLTTAVRLANFKIDEVNRESSSAEARRELISRIEIVEIHEDRAVQILRTLLEIARAPDASRRLVVSPELRRADAGERRIVFSTDEAWWTRLSIDSRISSRHSGDARESKSNRSPITEFEFTALADTARADQRTVTIQEPLINDLLERALQNRTSQASERQALFELLLPKAYKRAAAEERNVVLVVDDGAAALPWEIFLDRARHRGQGTGPGDAGILRTLKRVQPPVATYPTEFKALVVGDPTPPGDLDYPLLDGARDEADAVRESLRGFGWTTESRIRDRDDVTTSALLCALFGDDYRILHLAGHGTYDASDSERSGMVIGGGEGTTPAERDASRRLLTPGVVDQMRMTPELVFINCCHLGAIERPIDSGERWQSLYGDRHRLAGNLATRFIDLGVKAVVAAGWAVNDFAAKRFAQVFYDHMLSGGEFGGAVVEARRAAYQAVPSSNTWAAYQCYGPPQFRLIAGRSVGGFRQQPPSYVDPMEAIIDLENIAQRALHATSETEIADCRDDLERKVALLPRAWLNRADVREAEARAWGEMLCYEKAIDRYTSALELDLSSSQVTLRSIEQRANLRARWAEQKHTQGDSRAAVVRLIKKSLEELDSLLTLGQTAKRLRIRGSAHKSLAWVDARGRQGHLARMLDDYEAALSENQADVAAAQNILLAILLAGGPLKTRAKPAGAKHGIAADFEALLQQAEAHAAALEHRGFRFWDRVHVPDVNFLRALYDLSQEHTEAKATSRRTHVVLVYKRLLGETIGSVRQRDSVLRQMKFTADVTSGRLSDWVRGVVEDLDQSPR